MTEVYNNLRQYISDTIANASGLIEDIGNYNKPNTPAGAVYFGRKEIYDLNATVANLLNASPNTTATLANANNQVQEMFDCRILRSQLFKLNNHCYSQGYFLSASIILIGITIIFCFLFILVLLFAVGAAPEEKKQNYEPKPTKIYVETGGDDVVDINDNEKVPMS